MTSLRSKMTAAVALVAALVALGIGVAVDHQAAIDNREQLREQALDRLNAAVAAYAIDGRLRFGSTVSTARLPNALLKGVSTTANLTFYDGDHMWAARQLRSGVVLSVGLSAETIQQRRADLQHSLLLAGAIATLLAGVIGAAIAGSLSGRLRTAARVSGAIAAGSGDRIEVAGRDEVSELGMALNSMADALAGRLEAERAFTADVAHELRTPVTALVSSAELLEAGPATDLVRAQVSRMRRLVEDLLEISRLSADVSAELRRADLADQVRAAVARHPQLTASVEIINDASVLIEPRRLDRVLDNVLVNVARHGGGTAKVVVNAPDVVITDDGPGFPEEVLASGPTRFGAAGPTRGNGLGLTIAQRQLATMGGSLVCLNSAENEGGAQVRVHLSPAE